ncbi:MAG: bile acid:sodium symporter family protein [Verrucomicrobiae bacterium]|nr:bile acid:sodium symporter family protein [Verrucomicrobiae bacterium]
MNAGDIGGVLTRFLPVWVALAGLVGYVYPPVLRWLNGWIEWLFALTMLGIGATLTPRDFGPLVKRPQFVLLGTMAQFGIMPLLGFLVGRVLKLPADLALGFILVGAVPGAMASNVISYLARADVPYSIALTTCSTLLAPVLTPTFTYIFGKAYVPIPFWPMFFSIIQIVIAPLLVGLLMRQRFGKEIANISWVFPLLSTGAIALICGLVVSLNRERLSEVTWLVVAGVAVHNALGLGGGYMVGKLCGFEQTRRRTLAFEVGMQNAGLGAVLALKHFSAQAAIPNALFATWCVLTASVLAEIWVRKIASNTNLNRSLTTQV